MRGSDAPPWRGFLHSEGDRRVVVRPPTWPVVRPKFVRELPTVGKEADRVSLFWF